MRHFSELDINSLIAPNAFDDCSCGRHHSTPLKFLRIGRGVVNTLPEALHAIGSQKPFVVCDPNTLKAAGEKVFAVLDEAHIEYTRFVFSREERIEPDEWALGSIGMAYDPSCDSLLAVGSGVINDLCKVMGYAVGHPSLVVGTAPSMDGYASNSSSMVVDGVKTTLYNRVPQAIIADTEIMSRAPMRMLEAGLGDMLAKYISICEWRISNLITGEYYCEEVARLVRRSLAKCVENAAKLPLRDPEAVGAVAEGLILSGIAMSFATISRPASGLEHYFSHMWDMMALERGTQCDLHGIQVGVGVKLTMDGYKLMLKRTPDRAFALAAREKFDEKAWAARVNRVFGQTAQKIFEIEAQSGKNDPVKHAARVDKLVNNWPEILKIIEEELPDYDWLINVMKQAGVPSTIEEIGVNLADARDALICSRDIRDKYMSSSVMWDLGWLDDVARDMFGE